MIGQVHRFEDLHVEGWAFGLQHDDGVAEFIAPNLR
jgi:hypothetical protein